MQNRHALAKLGVIFHHSDRIVRFVATSSDTVEFMSRFGGGGEAYGAVNSDLRARVLDQGKRALRQLDGAP